MKVSLIHHSQLDKKRWDELVENTPDSFIYNLSSYLDAVAKDWFVFVDENFTCGIPFGATKKLGVKGVYPPFFQQHISPVGNCTEEFIEKFLEKIKSEFSYGTLFVHSDLLKIKTEQRNTQVLRKDDFELKTLAKRSVKKAEKHAFSVKEVDPILTKLTELIITFLQEKLPWYKSDEAQLLVDLVSKMHEKKHSYALGLFDKDNQLVGGVIGLTFGNRMIYLKGACSESAKQNGGMYLLIHSLIEHSFSCDLLFDFGGSNVEAVRYFNSRFSAKDVTYHCVTWDKSPWWFRLLRKLFGKKV